MTVIEPPYIFISHSHHDNLLTKRLCEDLTSAGIAVWVDLSDNDGGDFVERINNILISSQAVVVVISRYSLRSIAVRTEMHAAIHLLWQRRLRAILPVVAEPVEEWMIPPLWSIFRRFDVATNYERAVAELASAITSQRLGDYAEAPNVDTLVQLPVEQAHPLLPPAPAATGGSGKIVIEAQTVEGGARVIGYVAPQPLERQDVHIRINTLRDRANAIGYLHQPIAQSATVVSPSLFVFDVDGVLTNPETGQVAIDVMGLIAQLLQSGHVIALNSGRSLAWLAKAIVAPLVDIVWDVRAFDRLCIVSEKGATLSLVEQSGEIVSTTEPGILPVPANLRRAALQLLASSFADTMFSGEYKEFVLSPQMLMGVNPSTFKGAQARFASILQQMLEREGLAQQFRVDPTEIATDIEDHRLGKALGVRRVLAWLEERHIFTQRCIAFGDSPSDLQMAYELARRDRQVEFVYVGNTELHGGDVESVHITRTPTRYDRGTLAYLRQYENR